MTLVEERKHVVPTITDADGLKVFVQPDCPGAVWDRQIPHDIQAWLDTLDPANLPRGRITLRPDGVSNAIRHLCDVAGMPYGPEREWLQADIVELSRLFADLMEAQYLRLRLDVITTNACRKFHVDAITARLVCTYVGTGTQYGIAPDHADPDPVFTTPTGAPILLRGTKWPETPASGLRHRSPPIEGTGETRLILVLDPVSNPEVEI